MWNPIQEEIGNIDGPIPKLSTAARKKEKLQQQVLQPQQCEHQVANPVSHFDNNDNTVQMQRKVNKSGVKAMAAACLVLLLLITIMTWAFTCSDGWTGPQCDHDGPGVALEKVASHIKGITAAGLKFIEDALPKGARLDTCVPASQRFTYASNLWACAHF